MLLAVLGREKNKGDSKVSPGIPRQGYVLKNKHMEALPFESRKSRLPMGSASLTRCLFQSSEAFRILHIAKFRIWIAWLLTANFSTPNC